MAKQDRPAIKPASRAEFRKAMQEFSDEVKANIEMVEREQMRLLMRDAMTFSAPMPKGGGQGLSQAAWKAGKNKLGNDVRRIFIPLDEPVKAKGVFLRQIINAVQGTGPSGRSWMDFINLQPSEKKIAGLTPVMRKIMQDTDTRRAFAKAKNYLNRARADGRIRPVEPQTTDLRGIHDKYKGRVGGRWPKNAPIGGPQYFVSTTNMLNAYIAERQAKVGWVKAGYADALAKIPLPVYKGGNTRNFGAYDAPWVDANKAGFGTFSVTKTTGGSAVAMVAGNNIGNINGVADDADVKNIVYGNRVQNLMDTVRSRNEDAIKRANKRSK
jgi:hypothetical protein